jgi:hypothetical protein
LYNGTFYIDTCKSYACKGIKTQIKSLPSKLSPLKKKTDGNASYFCEKPHTILFHGEYCEYLVNLVG